MIGAITNRRRDQARVAKSMAQRTRLPGQKGGKTIRARQCAIEIKGDDGANCRIRLA